MVQEAAQLSGHFTQQHAGCVAMLLQGESTFVGFAYDTVKDKYVQAELEPEQQPTNVAQESSYRYIIVATVFPGTFFQEGRW